MVCVISAFARAISMISSFTPQLRWKKSFVTWQIWCRRYGGQGGLVPLFALQKILFLEHYATIRKPKMMQKGIITFFPTYLTKVTDITSILKFLNTKSLVVKFQTPNLTSKVYTSKPNTKVIKQLG